MRTLGFNRGRLPRGYFVTTPLSIVNRMMGVESWTDPISLPTGSTIGGIPVGGGSGSFSLVPAASTTLALTAASPSTQLIQSTGGLAVTPPAATGSNQVFRFICVAIISGGSFTVDAKAGNASDVFTGWLQSYKATTFTPYPTASNSNLITFNGTTTGGAAIGDWFEIRDIGLHEWLIQGYTIQSGSIATMFSNH